MKKHTLTAIAIAIGAGSALAADATPYAKVASLSGVVTVSGKNQMVNAKAGMALQQGSNVMSSITGTATVQFASGCSVFLKPGQMLSVQESACSAIQAKRTSVGVGGSQATGGEGEAIALGLTPLELTALALLSVGVTYDITKNDKNPSTSPTPSPAPSPAPVAPPRPPSLSPS